VSGLEGDHLFFHAGDAGGILATLRFRLMQNREDVTHLRAGTAKALALDMVDAILQHDFAIRDSLKDWEDLLSEDIKVGCGVWGLVGPAHGLPWSSACAQEVPAPKHTPHLFALDRLGKLYTRALQPLQEALDPANWVGDEDEAGDDEGDEEDGEGDALSSGSPAATARPGAVATTSAQASTGSSDPPSGASSVAPRSRRSSGLGSAGVAGLQVATSGGVSGPGSTHAPATAWGSSTRAIASPPSAAGTAAAAMAARAQRVGSSFATGGGGTVSGSVGRRDSASASPARRGVAGGSSYEDRFSAGSGGSVHGGGTVPGSTDGSPLRRPRVGPGSGGGSFDDQLGGAAVPLPAPGAALVAEGAAPLPRPVIEPAQSSTPQPPAAPLSSSTDREADRDGSSATANTGPGGNAGGVIAGGGGVGSGGGVRSSSSGDIPDRDTSSSSSHSPQRAAAGAVSAPDLPLPAPAPAPGPAPAPAPSPHLQPAPSPDRDVGMGGGVGDAHALPVLLPAAVRLRSNSTNRLPIGAAVTATGTSFSRPASAMNKRLPGMDGGSSDPNGALLPNQVPPLAAGALAGSKKPSFKTSARAIMAIASARSTGSAAGGAAEAAMGEPGALPALGGGALSPGGGGGGAMAGGGIGGGNPARPTRASALFTAGTVGGVGGLHMRATAAGAGALGVGGAAGVGRSSSVMVGSVAGAAGPPGAGTAVPVPAGDGMRLVKLQPPTAARFFRAHIIEFQELSEDIAAMMGDLERQRVRAGGGGGGGGWGVCVTLHTLVRRRRHRAQDHVSSLSSQLNSLQSAQMNRTLYMLTLITALAVPAT
jgi:hypothetical protein